MKVCLVDINRKIVLVMILENRSAINLARKIYFTPPQRRYMYIVHYECNDYEYIDDTDMYYWVSKIKYNYKQLQEWQTFPLTIIHRRKSSNGKN